MSELGQFRRKSVDVGGLALALGEDGRGNGWGGWDEDEISEAIYAELLSDMYTQTQSTVNFHFSTFTPLVIHGQTRERWIESLDSWNFEPNKLPEEEVLTCTYILFESLMCREGMQSDTSISLGQIGSFLSHLRVLYRRQNSFHNFRHALDVLQAIHVFLYSAGVVPPVSILMLCVDARRWKPDKTISSRPYISCLANEDLFALYVAAIGHDVGHPGFTNAFMKNAKAPLSLVYDNQSALEQMHYALLLSIMRYHGLGTLLDRPQTGPSFRKLLYKTLLATDLSIHRDFMNDFDSMVKGEDVEDARMKVLICQALIKCADISNPGRPHKVSKQWAMALMDEWTRQACLEKHLHMTPSVATASDDPLVEVDSQVFFISTFTKPLFALVSTAIPQMQQFAKWCQENLDIWQRRKEEITKMNSVHTKTIVGDTTPLLSHTTENFISAFPLTLPSILLSEEHHSDADILSADSRSSSSASDKPPSMRNVSSPPASYPVSPSESITLSTLTIVSRPDTSMSHSAQSNKSAISTISDSSTAIRAAYKASVRKKKSFHRTSYPGPLSSRENFPFGGHQLKSSFVIENGTNSLPLSPSDNSSLDSNHGSPRTSRHATISNYRTSKSTTFSALASVLPTS